ncbi:MAG: oligosaccharide flippase family protein [Pseudomonadota bacterium]|nr:oligosaccharide flippase family protein [Pseudomonadota bacterium]
MLKRNVIANYVGQIYIAAVGILIVPFYLSYLGAQGYGLVGFFTMIQGWLQLLDMGISTTLSREAARSRLDDASGIFFRRLQMLVMAVFVAVALLFVAAALASVDWIASTWLTSTLDHSTVKTAVTAISIAVAMRWLSGPWRSCLVGLERQVVLNIASIAVATLRFPLSLLVLHLSQGSITAFFHYQIGVAAVELLTYFLLACVYAPYKGRVSLPDKTFWREANPTFRFALSVAFTSAVWVLVTQLDKLLLSKLVPLAEYGYFSVAVVAASGISMLSQPLAQAVIPRLTALHAAGDEVGLISQYRRASRLVAAIVIPASIILGTFAEQVVWIWTGSQETAQHAAPILRWYAWGNGLLAISAFPYYLQYANGNLRLHILGNIFFVLFLVPAIYFASVHYGALGAAKVWFIENIFYFLFWTWFVHGKFLPSGHRIWLFSDIGRFLPLILVIVLFFYELVIHDLNSKLIIFSVLVSLIFVTLTINFFIFKRAK